MTIKNLIALLQKQKNQEAVIIISSDEEGNAYQFFGGSSMSQNKYFVLFPSGKYIDDEDLYPTGCDNCDHDENKPCEDIQEVKMKEEFEGGTASWCKECRERDNNFIAL